jgi:hypothetical protein
MSADRATDEPDESSGYERRDADVRKTFILIVAGVVILALILVGLNEYFSYEKDEEFYEIVLKPESRELIEMRDREDRILNSYGLVDSLQGIYRIPIDSAMQEMLREAKAAESGE